MLDNSNHTYYNKCNEMKERQETMMNIREYFHNLYQQAGMDENKFNKVVELGK